MRLSLKKISDLKSFLDEKAEQFNRPEFIADDPISVPRMFSKREDIEIAGLFAAVLIMHLMNLSCTTGIMI
jgi:hypothetical protein